MGLRKLELTLIFILFFLAVVLGVGLGILVSSFEDTTDIASLEDFKPEIPSKIYDRNGNLISEIYTIKRNPVTFEKLPKNLINALLAIEDSQFFFHRGIHVKRVFGALLANIKSGSRSQGASTITMQLARTLFTGREKTWIRKIKETWLALKIEKKYSKNEILTLYFNQIYFGHGAYGIEAASQFYFSKHVENITLAECALLAGLPQSPNRLSPLKNPQAARNRQELVLEAMVNNKMITPKEAYNSFQDFWINFRLQMRSPSQSVYLLTKNRAPHFVEYVRQKLERLYGSKKIYTDGLKVYTSLDLEQQNAAEQYLREGLDRQNKIHKYTMNVVKENLDKKVLDSLDMLSLLFNQEKIDIGAHKNQERIMNYLDETLIAPLDMLSFLFGSDNINRIIESSYLRDKGAGEFQKVEGGMIAIEPKTGYITAMVGGSAFTEDNQINRAVQIRRQTGSGFKPYIYTSAIDTKIFTPASIIVDSPVIFYDGEKEWIPDNYGGRYRGKMRLREALRRSVNVITAKIVDRLGVDTVVKYSSNILGITDPEDIKERFPRVYSIALGVVELSPYEQAKGFATFANGGNEVTPIAILYVLDRDGNLLDNFEADLRKEQMSKGVRSVISEQTNYIMVDMLRDVLRPGGTGYRAAQENGFDKTAAGKTGTTQNWKDAWFTGFTPDLVASVWVGFDRNSISLGRGQAGGVVAAPIWAQFMRDSLKNQPDDWFVRPNGVYRVKVCKISGLLPTKECADTVTELFLEGTIPTEYCYECKESVDDKTFNVDIFKRKKDSSGGILNKRIRSSDDNIPPDETMEPLIFETEDGEYLDEKISGDASETIIDETDDFFDATADEELNKQPMVDELDIELLEEIAPSDTTRITAEPGPEKEKATQVITQKESGGNLTAEKTQSSQLPSETDPKETVMDESVSEGTEDKEKTPQIEPKLEVISEETNQPEPATP
jgi:penicillin-binding protein 1A